MLVTPPVRPQTLSKPLPCKPRFGVKEPAGDSKQGNGVFSQSYGGVISGQYILTSIAMLQPKSFLERIGLKKPQKHDPFLVVHNVMDIVRYFSSRQGAKAHQSENPELKNRSLKDVRKQLANATIEALQAFEKAGIVKFFWVPNQEIMLFTDIGVKLGHMSMGSLTPKMLDDVLASLQKNPNQYNA